MSERLERAQREYRATIARVRAARMAGVRVPSFCGAELEERGDYFYCLLPLDHEGPCDPSVTFLQMMDVYASRFESVA